MARQLHLLHGRQLGEDLTGQARRALLQTLELALVALVLLGQVAQIPNPAQELDDGSLERQDVRHGGALRLSLTRRRVEGKTKAAKWLNQWNFPDFWCDRR